MVQGSPVRLSGVVYDKVMGKWLIIAGLVIAALGVVVYLLERTGFRGLPGDIRYESENVKVYFPIATSIVLSILLTLIMWLVSYLRNR